LGGPPPTLLPDDDSARAALDAAAVAAVALDAAGAAPPAADGGRAGLAGGDGLRAVAAAHPSYALAWALLAERARSDGDPVAAYAFARTGYHRSLDLLRRNGWKGHGPVPWEHPGNEGFLRSVHELAEAAAAIGETPEAERCATFLADSSPSAAAALSH
jgi:hypothetical protein